MSEKKIKTLIDRLRCPKCKKFIPVNATNCPKCNAELTYEERKKSAKTVNRWTWFILIVISIVMANYQDEIRNYSEQKKQSTQQAKVTENAQTGEVTITVTDDDSGKANQETISYTILPYSFSSSKAGTKNGRASAAYKIILEENDTAKINAENILATVASAAKYYAQRDNKKIVQIVMYDQIGENWGQVQLANIVYAPDGKGFGNDSWYWNSVMSSKRTTTQQEKRIATLWNSMRKNYQTAEGTDEERLKQAISQKLNISADDVHLPYLMWESPKLDFSQVKAQAPVK